MVLVHIPILLVGSFQNRQDLHFPIKTPHW